MKRREKVELFEEIRREYEHGVGTIQGVAKKLGVHRRTVRETLAGAMPKERKKAVREKPKLGGFSSLIDEILEGDRRAPRKQRHTAHRIWRRLVEEAPGFEAAESTVRQYVSERRRELGLMGRETFVPQSYRFGGEAQVDWFEARAELDGDERKVNIFCMRSMASGGAFHRAYAHASQQAFLEGHELAFSYFGGVFEVLRYDNLASAVKKILKGYQREETARFIAFRSHWGFESSFCTPGEGHEKGGVEGEAGYFRRNHLVPVPKARDLDELNRHILDACRGDERRVISGKDQSVGEGMNLERPHLLPLASEGFDLARVSFPEVNGQGIVKVLTNFYSVPLPAGTKVTAKVHASHVEIWRGGRLAARHERCFGRYKKVLDLEHYLEVLLKKPGALAGSAPLEQWRERGRWPESYDRLWEVLKKRNGKQDGTRVMIEVVMLGRDHGYKELEKAVEEALELGCSDVAAVRLLLGGENGRLAEPVDVGALSRYDRPKPQMEDYDRLLRDLPPGGLMQ